MILKYGIEEYKKRTRGCFIGKSVGGTLGMPFEGNLNVNEVTYYDPVPTAMVANDDLDLQVIALEIVRRRGLPVTARYLSDMWLDNVMCCPDEYGVAANNATMGLRAPLTGYFCNRFGGGMGAAIRSELWACLAPGDPDLAVRLAREDACTDHCGDGVDACLFLTAVESQAFMESDAETLIETGLKYISRNVRMTSAFRDTIKWFRQSGDVLETRGRILENYPSQNWTDVTINLSLIILAWLSGEGDFSKCICTAASLGYDADCTTATLGAILGIIDLDAIEEKWTWPIGNELVLSSNIVGMHEDATIDIFCDRICETCVEVQKYYSSKCALTGDLPAYTGAGAWTRHYEIIALGDSEPETLSIAEVSPLAIKCVYPDNVMIPTGERTLIKASIGNPMDRRVCGEFTLRAPDGFIAEGCGKFELAPGECADYEIYVEIPQRLRKRAYINPLDFIFAMDGITWTVTAGMVAPITWIMDGRPVDVAGTIAKFGAGAHVFEGEFKLFTQRDNLRVLAQGTRPVRAEIDGEVFTDHGDEQYVPALHRCRDVVIKDFLSVGWHKVRVEIGEGNGADGEFFFNLGTRYGWKWLTQVEWRIPE